MSNEFDDLRGVLTGRAKAIAFDLGYPIQLPNAPFVEPSGSPWLNFWYKLNKPMMAELGGPKALEVSVGVLQFDILVPEETGDGLVLRIANQIKKKINRKQYLVGSYSYVNLDPAGIEVGLPTKSGWYRNCVDATFLFHHRDPDAEAFRDF